MVKPKQFKPIFDSPSPQRSVYASRTGPPGFVSTMGNSVQYKLFLQSMAQWKRRNKISEEHRIFCLSGQHPYFKKVLLERGWLLNKDIHSNLFDLKWAQKGKDIDTSSLNPNQIVNHFQHTGALTTKVGLCNSLKNLHCFASADPD